MTKKSRIDGTLHRSFALTVHQRAADPAGEGEALPAENLILTFPFSSEEPYLRTSWWDDPWLETLGHDDGECDLTRLSDGAPVMANHGRAGTGDSPLCLIGITTRAWIEGNRGMVEVKLSRREGMEGLLQDLADGIVRNVSVGYQILERTLVRADPTGATPDEYRVTRWLPLEVSLVDVPADATVGLGRSHGPDQPPGSLPGYRVVELPELGAPSTTEKGITMSQAAQHPGAGSPTPAEQTAAREAESAIRSAAEESGRIAERTRIGEIREAVRSGNLEDAIAEDFITRGVSADEARREVLRKMAERSAAQGISSRADIHTVRDETETRRSMAEAALLHRYNPREALPDGARQYRGMSLIELSRDLLETQGINTRGMDRMQLASRALEGTSDLPSIVANVANKTLRQAYSQASRTFTAWARQTSAPDFKTLTRVSLSDAPVLETVNENGEFKRGAFTDGKETYQLVTVGKIIGLTRQVIINDDLQAFTRIPALFGAAAANYESDTVYGVLTANAALADTVALFHSTHGNLAGSGGAISVTTLDAGRAAMRVQKTPRGVVMNLAPAYLIVPAAKETLAGQYTSADFVSAKSSDINPFKSALQVVVEARLDANSTTAWYLAADSNQIDTLEYCYLDGQEGVYIETRQGFDTDGVEIKARLDFAAKAIDYRGLYKNPGA